MTDTTGKYQLVHGKHYTIDPVTGDQVKHEAGAVIELTPAQATAFADKFKPVAVIEAEAQVALAAAAAANTKPAKAEPEPKAPKEEKETAVEKPAGPKI